MNRARVVPRALRRAELAVIDDPVVALQRRKRIDTLAGAAIVVRFALPLTSRNATNLRYLERVLKIIGGS